MQALCRTSSTEPELSIKSLCSSLPLWLSWFLLPSLSSRVPAGPAPRSRRREEGKPHRSPLENAEWPPTSRALNVGPRHSRRPGVGGLPWCFGASATTRADSQSRELRNESLSASTECSDGAMRARQQVTCCYFGWGRCICFMGRLASKPPMQGQICASDSRFDFCQASPGPQDAPTAMASSQVCALRSAATEEAAVRPPFACPRKRSLPHRASRRCRCRSRHRKGP